MLLLKKFTFFIILSCGLILLGQVSGCRSYARYKTGGEIKPRLAQKNKKSFSTNQYLKLGELLQSYLGRPYKGKSKYEKGLDCSFFTSDVYRKFNKTTIPRTVKEQYKIGKEVAYKRLQYGDLMFFKTERNKVSHVAIFVGEGKFIHASTSKGVVISSMSNKYWSERYAGARRVFFFKK